jgi:6-pyruvoyltetrahydropterin/6-carboxytetrahydropterin synthase
VEIVLETASLDENDMVCDFKVVKEAVGGFIATLDHSMCMNTADPKYAEMKAWFGDRIIGFQEHDPTTEMIAKLAYDKVVEHFGDYASDPGKRYPLRPEVRVVKVRVWETSNSWAEYEP